MDNGRNVQRFIKYLSDVTFDDLPVRAIERTKLAVMDFLGNALGSLGTGHEPLRMLLNLALEFGGREESTVFGLQKRINCLDAAMVHGILGNFLDFSDGHFMGAHINDRVVPAALAVAERIGATGEEFVTAVLAGYEAYVRLGYSFSREVDPVAIRGASEGILGPLASTIAVGKLLGLSSEQMAGAMGLASSIQNCATQYSVSGGHEKTLSPGHDTRRAVLSALAAQKGVLGSKDILEGDRGLRQLIRGPIDFRGLTERLGEEYRIEECYFKPYPACRYLHASIDAATKIVQDNEVDPEKIRRVTVTTNKSSARRSTYNIASHVSAIFSHPYQVAVVLAEGQPALPTFWKEKKQKRLIAELMGRIRVEASPEFDRLYRNRNLDYGTWPSRVEVSTNEGHRCEVTVLRPKGDPTNPMTVQELEQKFRKNALNVLEEDEIRSVLDRIHCLERVDLRGFCQELATQTVERRLFP